MEPLAEQVAIQKIVALKAKYFRLVDTKQWRALSELFTPNATLFFPENQAEPVGIGPAMEFISQALEGAVSVHQGYMPEIEVSSPDEARGIWAMEDRLYFERAGGFPLGYEYIHGFGHYHEEYVRMDGSWLIHRLTLSRLRLERHMPSSLAS